MIHTSAPGKLIMFGEHVSRYGKPSIVFAVSSRLHIFLEPRQDDKIILNSPDLNIMNEQWPSNKLDYASVAIKNFFEKTGKKAGFNINSKSEMKEGIGTSAATVVAVLGALDKFFETNLSKKEILELGFKTIFDIQGYGSGIDIAAATYGGIIRFVKDQEPVPISQEKLPIVVGNVGFKVKSGPIVEAVKAKEEKHPEIFKPIIDTIGNIAGLAENAIKNSDLETLGELININHGLLYADGVSSDKLEKLVWAAKDAGAYGAKLSGAGVGDNMIALVPEDKKDDVKQAITAAGGKVLDVEIDPQGLKIED
jgi:mevalonate kinase